MASVHPRPDRCALRSGSAADGHGMFAATVLFGFALFYFLVGNETENGDD
ncbi:hypothetical protein GCM10027176_36790 [Actinoallomurus bryophytorum]|nr:hypothetical protein [Actinoallomurus bryophytorum]